MKLKVFEKAYQSSLEMHRFSQNLPKTEQYELASQLRKSSKSICANLVEGFGKRESDRERLRFLRIAIGSTEEVKLWLTYCRDLGYLHEEKYQQYHADYEEIAKMLEGLRKRLNAES